MRSLLGIQQHLTLLLVRTRVSSRVITFTWFVVALTAHAITALGMPWTFVLGAVILYGKVMLDITDGEVGRFQKQNLDPVTDVKTHMQGIYLDRIQHAIESPIWGLALGWGAYQVTGWQVMLYCGLCIAACSLVYRFERVLRKTIVADFQQAVRSLQSDASGSEMENGKRGATILSKVLQTGKLWIVNGKRFNLLVLLCGLGDVVLHTFIGTVVLIPALLASAALVWVTYVLFRLVYVQFSAELFDEAAAASRN